MQDNTFTSPVEINLVRLLSTLSTSLDFSNHGILRHHHRVALISLEIALESPETY